MSDLSNKPNDRIIKTRLTKAQSITGAVTALIVCTALFFWLYGQGLNLVNQVKGGHPVDYPDITFEQAFSQFYSNPKWENASTDGAKIVRFSGECTYDGRPAQVVLNFQMNNDNTFRLYDGTINGTPASLIVLAQFQSVPFEQYIK